MKGVKGLCKLYAWACIGKVHINPSHPSHNALTCENAEAARGGDPCRYIAALENFRRYRARQPKAAPRDATCRDCGATWLLQQGQSGPRPTRCAGCRRIAQAEASRRHEEKRR